MDDSESPLLQLVTSELIHFGRVCKSSICSRLCGARQTPSSHTNHPPLVFLALRALCFYSGSAGLQRCHGHAGGSRRIDVAVEAETITDKDGAVLGRSFTATH